MADLPPLPDPVSFDDTIANLKKIETEFKPDTCIPKEPLINFNDTGTPPLLDFNLPQSTAFTTYGRINVPIDQTYFKAFTKLAPEYNYWKVIEGMTPEQINQMMHQNVMSQPKSYMAFVPVQMVGGAHIEGREGTTGGMKLPPAGAATQPNYTRVGGFNPNGDVLVSVDDQKTVTSTISMYAAQGLRPIMVRRINNLAPATKYIAKPPVPFPRITVIEEYTTSSFLGNYGAGRVVKTLSLMPGERTTISMRTYKDMTSVRESSQNILDSFSDTSAKELDQMLQYEQGNMEASSDTSGGSSGSFSTNTDAQNSTRSFSLGANLSFANVGVSGGYGQSNSSASSGSSGWNNGASYGHTGARSSNVNTINNALTKHVQSSNSTRQININTSTTDTARSGEEDTTVREIMNYNKSRVINFMFRQLLQEYTVITALTNLKFVYSNGYPESFTVVDLNNLDNMLIDLIEPAHIDAVKCSLLQNYCQVLNYEDEMKDFLDRKKITKGACFTEWLPDCGTVDEYFWRVKPGLQDTYDPEGANITVKGVILSVRKETLQTSSVIADALLGRGEALDCYNQKAQDSESLAAYINNLTALQSLQDSIQNTSVNLDYAAQQIEMGTKQIDKMDADNRAIDQQLDIMDSLTDPADQVAGYKKIFGNCCPTPQYTGGCGCGNCKE